MHDRVVSRPCDLVHDLANSLAVIVGSADLASRRLEPDHPAAAHLARVTSSSNHAVTLLRELRSLICHDAAEP